MTRSRPREEDDEEHARAERIAGVIGVIAGLLVIALIGFLAWEAIFVAGTPPRLVVEPGEPRVDGAQFVMPISVRNTGTETASDVVVGGTLGEATSLVTLDYVPGQSSAEAALVFPAGGEGEPELRILGFTRP